MLRAVDILANAAEAIFFSFFFPFWKSFVSSCLPFFFFFCFFLGLRTLPPGRVDRQRRLSTSRRARRGITKDGVNGRPKEIELATSFREHEARHPNGPQVVASKTSEQAETAPRPPDRAGQGDSRAGRQWQVDAGLMNRWNSARLRHASRSGGRATVKKAPSQRRFRNRTTKIRPGGGTRIAANDERGSALTDRPSEPEESETEGVITQERRPRRPVDQPRGGRGQASSTPPHGPISSFPTLFITNAERASPSRGAYTSATRRSLPGRPGILPLHSSPMVQSGRGTLIIVPGCARGEAAWPPRVESTSLQRRSR